MANLPTLAETLAEARDLMRDHVADNILSADPVVYFCDGRLMSPEDFEPRFDQLRTCGYSWLNFNIAGLLEGKMVVSIEQPFAPEARCPKTAVNFSGPSRGVVEVDLSKLG